MSTEGTAAADGTNLERRVSRLATERTALFGKSGTTAGLSKHEHQRLKAIEHELDECFVLRRQQRAARDARRFSSDRVVRRSVPRRVP